MNFYWKIGLAAVVVLAMALVALFLLPGGDEREIERLIESAADEARGGNAESVVALVSINYRSDTEGYEEVCARIRSAVASGRCRGLEIRDLQARVSGDSGSARFTIRKGPHFERKIEADFRREAGGWRVTSAR